MWQVKIKCAISFMAVVMLAGCANSEQYGVISDSATGMATSMSGEFLAYEHTLDITLPADKLETRIQQVQNSCTQSTFGKCNVLRVSYGSDEGYLNASLQVRIVPTGVEPLLAAASLDAKISKRTTQAQDLAQVVQDTNLQKERLLNERVRLMEYQARRDITVADLMTISQRLAELEVGIEEAQRNAAQYQHRIQTQLVTMDFIPSGGRSSYGEVRKAMSEFGGILSSSTAWLVRILAALIPFLIALTGVVMLWRWRKKRKLNKQKAA